MSLFCCGFDSKKLEQKLQNILSLIHQAIDGTIFTGIIQPTGKVIVYQCKSDSGIRQKVEQFLEICLKFRQTQEALVKNTGHDFSRETVIRSKNTIIYLYRITRNHYLVIELNLTLQQAEFFDAELYSMNIDQLLEELTKAFES